MMNHDPLCAEYGNTGWIHGIGDCQCDLIARVRADTVEMEANRTIKARDRCRLNSDAWSRLDRLVCGMFEDARALRGDQ